MGYGHIEELRYTGQGGGASRDAPRTGPAAIVIPHASDDGIGGFEADGLGATKDERIGTRTSRLRDREGDNGDG